MLKEVVKFAFLILLTTAGRSSGCPDSWFDCGNGKCISNIWHCDGDNDCENLKDEENCEIPFSEVRCNSSQFQCKSDKHCIPERWHCDGAKDCDDGSDETNCGNVLKCSGFACRNNYCIPWKWHCDGNRDCPDGSDEEFCSLGKPCSETEYLCSSGSCINESLVCNQHKDCTDGSDEGPRCGDPCDKATCSQNCKNTPAGPECYCNDGYSLDKNNKTCSDIDECLQEGFCSHKCENTPGSYKCTCNSGYELVNRTCRAKGANPLLVFTTLQEIRAMHLRSERYYLVRRAVTRASAVDVDPKTEQIYWVEISNRSSIYSAKTNGSGFRTILSHADMSNKEVRKLDTFTGPTFLTDLIYSARTDGSGLTTILSYGLQVPEDIAVDYVANNLYLTDFGLRQVLACKMDGTMCTVLHKENVGKPRSIVLDPAEGFMYWSDWGEETSGIYRSGMDGSHRIPLVSSGIGWPNGITIDHTTNKLYWADAKLNKIEYISLDGTRRKVILNETVFHPYSLTVFEDTLFWTDWNTFSLESCNKFTGHKMTRLARENGRPIMGVHVYHPVLTATVSNPCSSNECSHMCLLSPASGFTCACPHGFELGSDKKTCKMADKLESVFVNEGSRIFYIRPDAVGSEAITELPLPLRNATISKVDFDPNLRYLFVAYLNSPAIYAVNMSSPNTRILVRDNIATPEDLSFDWRSNNLYWVDSGKGSVEVIAVDSLKRATILENLNRPVAIAISPVRGLMFVATVGLRPAVNMYDMDGRNRRLLRSVHGRPMSLSLHPSKSILYWADPSSGSISYLDYVSSRSPRILKTRLGDIMSIAASEEYVYWTNNKRELNMVKGNITHSLQLPGQERETVIRRVTYSRGETTARKSECMIGNGGCRYLCLTSPSGKTCTCQPGLKLADDNVTCLGAEKSGSLFVNDGSSIFHIRPEAVGSEAITELPLPLSNATISKVDFDPNSRCLFVAYFNPPAIYAVNMSSLNMRVLVKNNIPAPEDLSFDWRSNNLYWADSKEGSLEVISVDSLKRATILENLDRPVAVAISPASGIMFIATVGLRPAVNMYDMDGRNRRLLDSVQGLPMSLSLHPSKSILYWADLSSGTISYLDYSSSRSPHILKTRLSGIMSIAASEEYIFWTNSIRELNMVKGNVTLSFKLPGQERGTIIGRITYNSGETTAPKSECVIGNGGCSYLCLTSPSGRTCACQPGLKLAKDNVTCIGSRCSADDFQCKNGRCILKSWRCDRRNDCVDNSDEEDCPEATACTKEQISCKSGECVPILWQCDGEKDCADGTDEDHCNANRCDSESHHRCDNGQCISVSWICDGTRDCYDNSDERNCSKSNPCTPHEFKCNSDGSCVDEILRCDGRKDCSDGADERNCPENPPSCNDGMYRCKDGACIYDYEVCDGHVDCSNSEEEQNCTHSSCQPEEMLCPTSKRCIRKQWICDGDADCLDGSDEENCLSQSSPHIGPIINSTHEKFGKL